MVKLHIYINVSIKPCFCFCCPTTMFHQTTLKSIFSLILLFLQFISFCTASPSNNQINAIINPSLTSFQNTSLNITSAEKNALSFSDVIYCNIFKIKKISTDTSMCIYIYQLKLTSHDILSFEIAQKGVNNMDSCLPKRVL